MNSGNRTVSLPPRSDDLVNPTLVGEVQRSLSGPGTAIRATRVFIRSRKVCATTRLLEKALAWWPRCACVGRSWLPDLHGFLSAIISPDFTPERIRPCLLCARALLNCNFPSRSDSRVLRSDRRESHPLVRIISYLCRMNHKLIYRSFS